MMSNPATQAITTSPKMADGTRSSGWLDQCFTSQCAIQVQTGASNKDAPKEEVGTANVNRLV